MEIEAIRLDYRSAAAFRWKARGAPTPHGSHSEWKGTAPPTPLQSPSTAVASLAYNQRGGPDPPSLPVANHSEARTRREVFALLQTRSDTIDSSTNLHTFSGLVLGKVSGRLKRSALDSGGHSLRHGQAGWGRGPVLLTVNWWL